MDPTRATLGRLGRRRYAGLAMQVLRQWLQPSHSTADLVRQSYDRIAGTYDQAWTNHMRDLSLLLLDRLAPSAGARCLDLTCGTGFVTGELQRRTGAETVGVDSSAGMLAQARRNYPDCRFIQEDALAFLRHTKNARFDLVTCAWGLGYSQPWRLIQEAARVLKPGGRLGIIDNSLFSLAEVIGSSILTFAEKPEALAHAMNVRFLPGSWWLQGLLNLAGLQVSWRQQGRKTYHVPSGQDAIARLQATGAAAGFEFAVRPADRDAIFRRFAEVLSARYTQAGSIPVVHRWLAAVGARPC